MIEQPLVAHKVSGLIIAIDVLGRKTQGLIIVMKKNIVSFVASFVGFMYLLDLSPVVG